MKDPDVVARVLAAWRERDHRAPVALPGPDRSEMVELLSERQSRLIRLAVSQLSL